MPGTFLLLLFFFSATVLYDYLIFFIFKYFSRTFVFFALGCHLPGIFYFRPLAAKMYEMPYVPLCLQCMWKRVNAFSASRVCSLCHVLLLFVFCVLHNLLGAARCCLVRGWLQVSCVSVLPYFTCHSLMQKQPAAAAKESALFQFPFFPLLSFRKGRNHIWEHLWIH